MSGAHILVVDDEQKVRTLLRRCFEGEGFAVSDAKDGEEMRACLERNQVTLITLDLNLGRENGLDLARDIRKERNIPIIMLTGKGDAVDRVVGLELGADDTSPSLRAARAGCSRPCGPEANGCFRATSSSGQR